MKVAATSLFDGYHQTRIQAFKDNISYNLYSKLTRQVPEIKDRLLEIVRDLTSDKNAKHSANIYYVAADIFGLDSHKDLLPLLNRLPPHAQTVKVKLTIFEGLSRSKSSKLRQNGLDIILRGLKNAKRRLIKEVKDAFPSYRSANTWLSGIIDKRKLTYQSPALERNADARARKALATREKFFDQFITLANENNGATENVEESDDHMDDSEFSGEDSDRSDEDDDYGYDFGDHVDIDHYKQMQEQITLTPMQELFLWLEALGDWTSKTESSNVWDLVKESAEKDTVSDLLFAVDGLALHLAKAYAPLLEVFLARKLTRHFQV